MSRKRFDIGSMEPNKKYYIEWVDNFGKPRRCYSAYVSNISRGFGSGTDRFTVYDTGKMTAHTIYPLSIRKLEKL